MPLVQIAVQDEEAGNALIEALKESGIDSAELISAGPVGYKKIPRLSNGQIAPTFQTKDKTYLIIPPEDGVGFHRWGELMKRLISFQFGMRNSSQIIEYFNELMASGSELKREGMVNVHYVKGIAMFLDGITEQSDERNMVAAYICTIFIVSEGEDLSKWSVSEADAKIADWNAHNYDFNDFFTLALRLSKAYANEYLSRLEQLKETERLLDTPAT